MGKKKSKNKSKKKAATVSASAAAVNAPPTPSAVPLPPTPTPDPPAAPAVNNNDTRVIVERFDPRLTEDDLTALFGFCGTIVGCSIQIPGQLAYIYYETPSEAYRARGMDNLTIAESPLTVRPPVL